MHGNLYVSLLSIAHLAIVYTMASTHTDPLDENTTQHPHHDTTPTLPLGSVVDLHPTAGARPAV